MYLIRQIIQSGFLSFVDRDHPFLASLTFTTIPTPPFFPVDNVRPQIHLRHPKSLVALFLPHTASVQHFCLSLISLRSSCQRVCLPCKCNHHFSYHASREIAQRTRRRIKVRDRNFPSTKTFPAGARHYARPFRHLCPSFSLSHPPSSSDRILSAVTHRLPLEKHVYHELAASSFAGWIRAVCPRLWHDSDGLKMYAIVSSITSRIQPMLTSRSALPPVALSARIQCSSDLSTITSGFLSKSMRPFAKRLCAKRGHRLVQNVVRQYVI